MTKESKRNLTNRPTNEITCRMRAAGFSVRLWAEHHGFRQQTVRNLLGGAYKNRQSTICNQIREQLKKDGFMP